MMAGGCEDSMGPALRLLELTRDILIVVLL